MNNEILIGNSFPFSLIRRKAQIEPCSLKDLQEMIRSRSIISFWGHRNTLDAVNRCLGADLTPEVERPALSLSGTALPMYNGKVFNECWIVSPDYRPGFRPAVGGEVSPDQILGWQCLHIVFLPDDQDARGPADLSCFWL